MKPLILITLLSLLPSAVMAQYDYSFEAQNARSAIQNAQLQQQADQDFDRMSILDNSLRLSTLERHQQQQRSSNETTLSRAQYKAITAELAYHRTTLTAEELEQFKADQDKDFYELKPTSLVGPRDYLAYVRLWLRTHPQPHRDEAYGNFMIETHQVGITLTADQVAKSYEDFKKWNKSHTKPVTNPVESASTH